MNKPASSQIRRIALSALVVSAMVGLSSCLGLNAKPSSTVPPVSSTTYKSNPPASPTPKSEETPKGVDYGPFPPKNIKSLKTLHPVAQFPPKLGTYAKTKESIDDSFGSSATYVDAAKYVSVSVNIRVGTHHYRALVKPIDSPKYYGNAVCGKVEGDLTYCVMAGTGEALHVLTASSEVTVETIATLTQDLYKRL